MLHSFAQLFILVLEHRDAIYSDFVGGDFDPGELDFVSTTVGSTTLAEPNRNAPIVIRFALLGDVSYGTIVLARGGLSNVEALVRATRQNQY